MKLIVAKASAETIALHLQDIAETWMSISGNEAPTRAAAEKLAALADQN